MAFEKELDELQSINHKAPADGWGEKIKKAKEEKKARLRERAPPARSGHLSGSRNAGLTFGCPMRNKRKRPARFPATARSTAGLCAPRQQFYCARRLFEPRWAAREEKELKFQAVRKGFPVMICLGEKSGAQNTDIMGSERIAKTEAAGLTPSRVR